MCAVILAGAFLRFWRLPEFPVGFHFDEAANLLDIWRLGPDFHPIYFTANNGREPLFFYWQALFVATLGPRPWILRLAAAFLGVLTLPAIYFCFSRLLRGAEGTARACRLGILAATVCAFLFIHVNFSRIGLRTISLPLFECLAFGMLWKAVASRHAWLAVAAGLLMAACLYTYTAARLLLIALVVYGAYLFVRQRHVHRARQLAIAAGAFVVGVLPLGLYALANANEFFQRTTGVAITNGSEVRGNVLAVARMFVIEGSLNGAHNIPGMPFFDWPMRIAFVAGLVILVSRLNRPVYVFVVLWLAVIAVASVFSPDAPYYIRLTGLIPPAAFIAALALEALPGWLARLVPRGTLRLAYLPTTAALLASAVLVYDHYFLVWGPSNDTYFWMMQDKVDAAKFLNVAAASGDHVYLAPLYAQDWTFLALGRGQPIGSFDPAKCTVAPVDGRPATYAFPPYDATQPALLEASIQPASQQPVLNNLGQPVLIDVTTPGSAPAPAVALGEFDHEIALVRTEGLPNAPVSRGGTVHLSLGWRALGTPSGDFTAFVHADDTAHQRRIQQDHFPCGGSDPTWRWQPTEMVSDSYDLAVPGDAPAGTYQLTAGLYEQPGPRNLKLPDGSSELRLGSFEVR